MKEISIYQDINGGYHEEKLDCYNADAKINLTRVIEEGSSYEASFDIDNFLYAFKRLEKEDRQNIVEFLNDEN